MAKEVVIHTWCDIEFSADDPSHDRVDARTVTWFLEGQRMEIDLCPAHMLTPVIEMDEIVSRYGRPWKDPALPSPGSGARRRSRRVDPRDHVLVDACLNEDEHFVCTVAGCPREQEPIQKIQGLRMHQFQVHGMRAPTRSKSKR